MFTAAQVTLMVADFERSLQFYTDTLGLALKRRHGNGFAEVTAPGLTIGIHSAVVEGPRAVDRDMSIGLQVDDMTSAVAALEGRGVAIEQRHESGQALFADFRDPDGMPLYLFQSKHH